jgi:hypothetical protein
VTAGRYKSSGSSSVLAEGAVGLVAIGVTLWVAYRCGPSDFSSMKAYVIATGVVFGLLTLVHLWRIAEEPHLASDPWFMLVTVVSAALGLAAWRLVRRSTAS